MKKVRIDPGCITCGLCEFIAPEVFNVTDICHVKENVDFDRYQDLIDQAARACPVAVIVMQEKKKEDNAE
jgi:ferredoxin